MYLCHVLSPLILQLKSVVNQTKIICRGRNSYSTEPTIDVNQQNDKDTNQDDYEDVNQGNYEDVNRDDDGLWCFCQEPEHG